MGKVIISAWERCLAFCIRKRRQLTVAASLAFAAVLLLGGLSIGHSLSLRRAQRDFLRIGEGVEAERFVGKYGRSPLGALAAYALAAECASDGNFSRAADLYAGCRPLRAVRLDGAAALAEAVAATRDGDGERARRTLTRLAADGTQLPTVRDGARYLTALAAYGDGDWEASRLALGTMEQSTGVWQRKAALLALALRERGR